MFARIQEDKTWKTHFSSVSNFRITPERLLAMAVMKRGGFNVRFTQEKLL